MQHAAATDATPVNPPIHLIDAEYDIIADLALGIERRSPELSKMLLDEIDRAEIHARDTLPPEVVSLGSDVEFLDVATGATRQVRLVLPPDADIAAGRVSILTRSEEHPSALQSLLRISYA